MVGLDEHLKGPMPNHGDKDTEGHAPRCHTAERISPGRPQEQLPFAREVRSFHLANPNAIVLRYDTPGWDAWRQEVDALSRRNGTRQRGAITTEGQRR